MLKIKRWPSVKGWLLIIISNFFLSFSTQGQSIFSGRLVNEYRRPVSDALIWLKNQETHAHSDENGYFKIEVNGAPDTLTIQHSEYEVLKMDLETLVGGKEITLTSKHIELEEVTVVGTKPSFNYLSRVDLSTRPILNSQDLLRIVPGLFIAQHAGGGKAEQIFLRGFDIDHGTDINLSVDGLPVNMVSHAHGQGYADMHFVIPELVKDIEYGKGPYYASKGNFTTAGYAHFQTMDKPLHSRVQLEGGRFNTGRALMILDLSPSKNESHYGYVAGELNYTDGPFESPQNFNRMNVYAKYSFKLTDKTRLNLLASSFSSKWDASGQIPERAVRQGLISRWGAIDDSEGGNTARKNLSVGLTNQLSPHSYFQHQLYYSSYDFNLFSNFTFFLRDSVNGDQIEQAESRNIYGYQGSYHLTRDFGKLHWSHSIGVGGRYDEVRNIGLHHAVQRRRLDPLSLGDLFETNVFAFIDERVEIGKFIINPSIRFDAFRFEYANALDSLFETGNQLNAIVLPKLNILYNWNSNVQFYTKMGKGFHSNDTRVVVAQKGFQTLPAAYGADIGSNFRIGKRFIGNVALWYLFLQQEFVYVGDEAIVEPSGKTERKGLDLSARWQLFDWLSFDSDFNWAFPKALNVPKEESYIPLAPRITSSGGITFGRGSGLNGGIRYRYLADRPADETNFLTAQGYFIWDASINFTKPKYQITSSILNLFDTQWKEAQFSTESKLRGEPGSTTEIHYTPGIPFFVKVGVARFF